MGNQNSTSESDQNRRVGKIMAWVAAIGVPSAVILAAQHTIYKQHVTGVPQIVEILNKHFSDYETKMSTEKAAMREFIRKETATKDNLNKTIETINKLLGEQTKFTANTKPLVDETKKLSELVKRTNEQRKELTAKIDNMTTVDNHSYVMTLREKNQKLQNSFTKLRKELDTKTAECNVIKHQKNTILTLLKRYIKHDISSETAPFQQTIMYIKNWLKKQHTQNQKLRTCNEQVDNLKIERDMAVTQMKELETRYSEMNQRNSGNPSREDGHPSEFRDLYDDDGDSDSDDPYDDYSGSGLLSDHSDDNSSDSEDDEESGFTQKDAEESGLTQKVQEFILNMVKNDKFTNLAETEQWQSLSENEQHYVKELWKDFVPPK